jgi:hypothetical protein
MAIVMGFDIHREQITFDALDDVTGELRRGRITPADRVGLRRFLASLPVWRSGCDERIGSSVAPDRVPLRRHGQTVLAHESANPLWLVSVACCDIQFRDVLT